MNHLKTNKQTTWSGEPNEAAIQLLQQEDKVIVCPTKVGYIIAVSDKKGLERKFSAKNRKRNKPGVVLCSSLEQLQELAEWNDEIAAVYQKCWDNDVLFGAILPWKESGKAYIPDGSQELMMDTRKRVVSSSNSAFLENKSLKLFGRKSNSYCLPAQQILLVKAIVVWWKELVNKSLTKQTSSLKAMTMSLRSNQIKR